ncbi:hypothetical protein K2X96_01610 [Patescibacteria group bacterium]|nr:hypothetical protein [Patescibacteria group bacterium]
MDRFKNLISKLDLRKEKVISLLLTLVLTTLIFLDNNYFDHVLLTSTYFFSMAFLAVLLVAIMLLAGHAVYKSAIHASVGFGVLIFLAQTYCNLETKTPDGIEALNTLWTIGFIFIVYEFFNKLQEAYKAHTKPLRDDIKTKKWEPTLLMVIYSIFILIYISLITKVLTPIVLDLCIYKSDIGL